MCAAQLKQSASRSSAHAQVLLAIERTCWICGAAVIVMWLGVLWDSAQGRQNALEQLYVPTTAASVQRASALPALTESWSPTRVKQYRESLLLPTSPPLAVLRIQRVALEVPVFIDSRELHLNRGAGLIEGMERLGVGGNLGIAGHRDGFFRVLKDVHLQDVIEVQTRDRVFTYHIVELRVVNSDDTAPLADTRDPTITLVTCYPFYFVGRAPKRFIVHGTLEKTSTIETSRNTT
jgi:sortase A